MFRAGGGSAHSRRRASVTGRRAVSAHICASERRPGQGLPACVVCGGSAHLLAAFVYGSLTAMLIGLYFGTIVVLQRLFVALTGEKSTLAVVASTLVIAALFNPLRRRIQSFIDRRFYRKKYD